MFPDSKARRRFDTRAVHNGRDPALQGGMVNPPVYHGSTVVFPNLDALEQAKREFASKDTLIYGRNGTQSTFALENAIADLENGFGGISASSGLAAITTTILAFVGKGDHLLIADTVYGPTRYFCDQYLSRIGVDVEYYDPMIGSNIDQMIRPETRLIFLESPGSITFEVQDAPAIAEVASRHGVTTAMDNSWATPLFFRPIDVGINISVTSATKYIVGHADAMVGLVVADSEENYFAVKRTRDLLGQSLAPDEVFLAMRGLRTLGIRMRHHEQQAITLANWLRAHPAVERVLHPALDTCPGHPNWKRDFCGSSGLFSFTVPPRPRHALAKFLDNLELFSMGFSWGGFESLILPHNASRSRTATRWRDSNQILRVHAGLENIDDLIADLEMGLQRYMAG